MKKLLIVIFIIFSAMNVYSQTNNDLNSRIANFWEFIKNNETRLFNANPNDEAIHLEIYSQIQRVDTNLGAFIGTSIINNKKELVISSMGNSAYFDLCDQIVNIAPNLNLFSPVSLIPPQENIEPFTFGNITVSINDVRVHFENSEKIDLLFLLSSEHLTRIQNDIYGQMYNVYMQILFLMTQQILGERLMSEKINSGNIIPLSLVMPSIPLIDLKKHLE
jgi:hypothetical protein